MAVEGAIELPVVVVHPVSPGADDTELYPPGVRSLLASWQALRLERYMGRTQSSRDVGRETGTRV